MWLGSIPDIHVLGIIQQRRHGENDGWRISCEVGGWRRVAVHEDLIMFVNEYV